MPDQPPSPQGGRLPLVTRASELAAIASILAEEASALALLHSGQGHDSAVAVRAAKQAREASDMLQQMARDGAPFEDALQAATWALSAASVALAQAKLRAPGANGAEPTR